MNKFEKKKFKQEPRFENRAIIVEFSVMIEDALSFALSMVLKIKNRTNSLSFGTKINWFKF